MIFTPELKTDYHRMWSTVEIDYEPDQVTATAKRVFAVKNQCTGYFSIPWWFIALCWLRECDLNPKGVLHNGELIVGTGRKTRLVPSGRGPFATWAEATEDALKLQGLDKETDWSVEKVLYRFEAYNGFGYRNKGVPSPYLWSHTNHYSDGAWDDDPQGGKYVADGVYDKNAYDKQIGVAAILKELDELYGVLTPAEPQPQPKSRPQTETPAEVPAEPAWITLLKAVVSALTKRGQ